MSSLVMRPAAPVPATWLRSTSFSFAILRTSGEERSRPRRDGIGGFRRSSGRCSLRRRGGSLRSGGCCCRRAGGGSPTPPMTATTVLICTVGRPGLDLGENAGGRRWDFRVDLVGGDFEQRLVALRRCRRPA